VTRDGPVERLSAARDDAGADVSEIVRARDGRHLDFAGRGAYQGITARPLRRARAAGRRTAHGPLWLVAQGWVHPTDSSINVAVSQGRARRPRGLSLQVADAGRPLPDGARGLGLPERQGQDGAGRPRRGVPVRPGARRVRLATNLEVFWDRVGWARGRPT
jgi:hypothetical protein